LLKIPTAANVIELAKFQSRDGCFNAGNIQFISYIISLQQTTFYIEISLQVTISLSSSSVHAGHLETAAK
jgi:hypothetical protein